MAGEHKAAFWGVTSFWSLPYIHVVKHYLHCSLLKSKVSQEFVNLPPIMGCEEIWDAHRPMKSFN